MVKEVLQMSQRELDRIKVIHQAMGREITQEQAGRLLDLCRVQINRICQRIKKEGDRAIIHGLRGRPSNHQLPAGLADKAISKIKAKYPDFLPGFATEELLELDKVNHYGLTAIAF